MENLYTIRTFRNAVIDENGCMHQLPQIRAGDRAPDIREAFQKIDMIENGVAETFRHVGEVGPGIGKDFLKIA